MMVENGQIRGKPMKIYQVGDEDNPCVPKEYVEKISILKLCESGKYVKNVGIRDGRFFIIEENNNDKLYLEG